MHSLLLLTYHCEVQTNGTDMIFHSEFGHNDGGSLSTTDNGRTDCFGGGSETCISPTTGETIYTYVFYLLQAGFVPIHHSLKNSLLTTPQQSHNNQRRTPARRITHTQQPLGNRHLLLLFPTLHRIRTVRCHLVRLARRIRGSRYLCCEYL